MSSGGEGTRTLDLRLAKPPLFQLSYTPGSDRDRQSHNSVLWEHHRRPESGHTSVAPVGCGPVDARTFLGMEPDGDTLHWRMRVVPQLTTPGNFLFGGCGLGAALVALEAASGRPTVWATGHYLSYALTDAELVWEVTLAAVGGHVTQGRAVGSVDGREILTVNAALGNDDLAVGGVWVVPPQVPRPISARRGSCPSSSATPSWTALRCARRGAGPSRRWTVPPETRIPPSGHASPATSPLRPPLWPSSATTSPGRCRSLSGAAPWGGASTTRSAWCS